MGRDDLADWLRLVLTPGIGNDAARRLLAAFGLPGSIFEQRPSAWRQVVSPAQAEALVREPPELSSLLQTTQTWLDGADEQIGRRIVTLGDDDYPPSLLATEDPPLMLYLLGQTRLLRPAPGRPTGSWPLRALAIVGSRNPTPQGELNAQQFSRTLGASGLCIVSGLALGIDGAAHEGALTTVDEDQAARHLATIAVIGTGIDRVYPRRHRDLAHRIARQGLIVSEYPLGTAPMPGNFPKRNRLIAGLSRGTLVVEAAKQSGSLITARLAAEQGKEVFAIPGSIHTPQSRGPHALIRQGAKLVETAEDVLEELPWPAIAHAAASTRQESSPDAAIQGSAALLLDALGGDPVSLDALQARTGWDTATLQAQLLELELGGHIGRLPGGLFQRLART